MSFDPHPGLPDASRNESCRLLQGVLVDLLDLSLDLKQAHWNVRGPSFGQVHEQLDVIVAATRLHSDDVAERIVALGHPADGRAPTIAQGSRLEVFAEGFHRDNDIVEAVTTRLGATIAGARAAIEGLGDLDPISEDLVIGIVAELEKHHWMLRAQLGQQ